MREGKGKLIIQSSAILRKIGRNQSVSLCIILDSKSREVRHQISSTESAFDAIIISPI